MAEAQAEGTGCAVIGWCTKCQQTRAVDLQRLIREKGPDYSLINRRTRCTLMEGCTGWVRFHYQRGTMRHLWDEDTGDQWFLSS